MKKILLGVIALTSAASFGAQYEHLHGYLELGGKAVVKKPVSYEEKVKDEVKVKDLGDQSDVTYELGAQADLGVFMHENKEVFAFIGTDLNGVREGKNKEKPVADETLMFDEKSPYHFGLRWDSEIIDTFNIQLTAAHRRGGEGIAWETKNKLNNETKKVHKVNGIKYAVEKHLAAKGKKLDGTDQGYKLRPTDTFLLSAVLNGKIYNNFELTVAGLYNSADFKNGTHELETYVKTNGTLKENVKIANAEIKHVLNSDNYEKAGKLSGDVKIETKANNALDLTNEAKFTLDHILPKEYKENKDNVEVSVKEHNAEVEVLNNAKYTGIKNVELTGDINYKLGIKSRIDENGKDKGKDKGRLTHEPEVKLGVTVKPVKGLILSSNNSNKVVYAHDLNKGENEAKTSKFENQFTTENKVEYRPIDWLEIRGLAKYNLTTDLTKVDEEVEGLTEKGEKAKFVVKPEYKNTHVVLGGIGLTANKEVSGVKVESSIDTRYRFDAKSSDREAVLDGKNNVLKAATEPHKAFTHQFYTWTKNKVSYDFNENNKLEVMLNAHNYVNFESRDVKIQNQDKTTTVKHQLKDVFGSNVKEEYTLDKGKEGTEIGKKTLRVYNVTSPSVITLVNPIVKYTNVSDKFTNVLDVNAKYANLLRATKTTVKGESGDKNEDGMMLAHALEVNAKAESTYKALDNVDVILSVENSFNLNNLNGDVYGTYVDFIEKAGNNKKTFLDYAKDLDVAKQDKIKDSNGGVKELVGPVFVKDGFISKSLSVEPKLAAKLTYVDGKLTVNPWISSKFELANSNETDEVQKAFTLRSIEGKAGIKVDYMW